MTVRTKHILLAVVLVLSVLALLYVLFGVNDQARVASLLRRAERYESANDYDSAIISLRSALRLAPASMEVHARLAHAYGLTRRPEECLKHYDAALRFGTVQPGLLHDYADACIRYNNIKELGKPAERLLATQPDDPDGNLWMAMAVAVDDVSGAIPYAEKSLSKRRDVQAYIVLADLHVRNKNRQAAEACLLQGLAKFPDNPRLLAAMASLKLMSDSTADAEQLVAAALAGADTLEGRHKADVFAAAADVYARVRKTHQCLQALRSLVQIEPEDASHRVRLAQRLIASGRVSDAVPFLRDSLAAIPKAEKLRLILAEALIIDAKLDDADSELAKLSQADSITPYARYVRGSLFLARDDAPAAYEHLAQAARDLPHLHHAHLALGICHWKMGRLASAKDEFETVLKLVPHDREGLIWLGRCRLAQSDFTGAEQAANTVLSHDPGNADARQLLLLCRARRGDASAISEAIQAAKTQNDTTDHRLLLAEALAANGRLDDALAAADHLLAKSPDLIAAVLVKARILLAQNRRQAAEDYLATYAGAHPTAELAVIEYAALLAQAGKPAAARMLLVDLTHRLPKSVTAHTALAEFHLAAGRRDEAAASFLVAQTIQPKNLAIRRRFVTMLIDGPDFTPARAAAAATEIGKMKADFGDAFDVLALEGMLLLKQGKLDEALALFMTLSTRWPREAEAQSLIGAALIHKGDVHGAINAFLSARRLAPRDPGIRSQLRDAYLLAGLFDKATAEGRDLLALTAARADDLQKLAASLAAADHTGEAAKVLGRLTAAFPANTEYRLQLATLLAEDGKPDLAAKHVSDALAISTDPQPGTIWMACSVYWMIGQNDAARSLIDKHAAKDPRLHHSLLARHFSVMGDPARVEEHLTRLCELAPQDPSAACALGDLYASLAGRRQDAHAAYDRAAAIAPGYPYPIARKAALLIADGEIEHARALLTPLAEKHPDDPDVNILLAQVFASSGEIKAAIAGLQRLLDRLPGDAAVQNALATVYLQDGRHDECLRLYQAVLQRDPANYLAANNAAYLLAEKLNRPADAEKLIAPAVRRHTRSAPLLDTYGWVLHKAGKTPEARAALDRSLELDPAPLTMYHLAVVCHALGEADRARDLLRKALAAGQAFDHAADARSLLQSLE
ncbi:MAG TPA: tetratricopeptide repeat protein [Planctomycetota bacterium]|nr:tetratricopeptide repeat protein [Planctomycetota bacterium]